MVLSAAIMLGFMVIGKGGLGMDTAAAQSAYYVSPSGDDVNGSGTADSPFRTPEKARDAVRQQIAGGMNADVTVYLRQGVYRLDSTLTLTEADSGRDGHEVVYRSFPGEQAVLDGSRTITGWQPYSGNIYMAYVGTSWTFDTLYEGDSHAVKARYPNIHDSGNVYNRVEAAVAGADKTKFTFAAGGVPSVANGSGLETVLWPGGEQGFEYWYSYTVGVSGIEYADRIVTLSKAVPYVIGPGSRYYMQGALELLDAPGEFYLDKAAGMLYYYPRDVSSLSEGISAPYAGHVIEMKGASPTAPAQNIRLESLSIRNTDIGKDGVRGENVRNITLLNSRVVNTGDHGVRLFGWAQGNRLEGNEIHDIGYNGISVEGTAKSLAHVSTGNHIVNNHVYRVGLHYGNSGGIRIYDSGENVIAHNRVHGSPRYAIHLKAQRKGYLIGTTIEGVAVTESNYRDYQHARNNIVEFNDVSDAANDSQDVGIIATWGVGTGNIIRNNLIHDSDMKILTVQPNKSYGFGIYLDDNSDDVLLQNNVIHSLQLEGGGQLNSTLMLKGIGIRADNNIIAGTRDTNGIVGSTQNAGEIASQLELTRNIFYDNRAKLYHMNFWDEHKVARSDRNTFYRTDGIYAFGGQIPAASYIDWLELNKGKYDPHSLLADPLFMNAAKYDYRLRYDSPAYRTGYADINMDAIGLTEPYPFADRSERLASVFVKKSGESVNKAWTRLAPNGTAQLQVQARTTTGYAADLSSATISYTSSNPSAAAVDGSGLVTAVGSGIARITVAVTQNGATLSADFDVLSGDSLTAIGVNVPARIQAGASVNAIVYGMSSLGGYVDLTGATIQHVSDQPAVASVDTEGKITANAIGSFLLSVTVAAEGAALDVTIPLEVFEKNEDRMTFDFENGATGGWAPLSGIWQVVTDGTNKAYQTTTVSGSARSYWGLAKRTDYEHTAQFKVDSWGNGNPVRVGLIGRYVNSTNFYYAVYEHTSGQFKIFKIVNGTVSTLASSDPMPTDFTTGYRLMKFKLQGDSLALYLDGTEVVSATDATFGEGYPGLYTYNQPAYVDDMTIAALQ